MSPYRIDIHYSSVCVCVQWTPLGFKFSFPDSMDDISRERFDGTVLKAIPKSYDTEEQTADTAKIKVWNATSNEMF